MIVWINGTHGVGKSRTAALVQQLIPNSRVFDAEKVGGTLMDISPGLPPTDNFQHWAPWRPLVVETARRVLEYIGGTLVMPLTVLVEGYWRETSAGLATYDIQIRHFVLHADQDVLRGRILGDHAVSPFAFATSRSMPRRYGFTSRPRSSTPRTSRRKRQPTYCAGRPELNTGRPRGERPTDGSLRDSFRHDDH